MQSISMQKKICENPKVLESNFIYKRFKSFQAFKQSPTFDIFSPLSRHFVHNKIKPNFEVEKLFDAPLLCRPTAFTWIVSVTIINFDKKISRTNLIFNTKSYCFYNFHRIFCSTQIQKCAKEILHFQN